MRCKKNVTKLNRLCENTLTAGFRLREQAKNEQNIFNFKVFTQSLKLGNDDNC